ncbi:unnamed protein product, partial [Laminaria digitata]
MRDTTSVRKRDVENGEQGRVWPTPNTEQEKSVSVVTAVPRSASRAPEASAGAQTAPASTCTPVQSFAAPPEKTLKSGGVEPGGAAGEAGAAPAVFEGAVLSETTLRTERSVARAMAEAILDEGYMSSTSSTASTTTATAAATCGGPPVRSSSRVPPHRCPVKENGERKVALLGEGGDGEGAICLAVNSLKCTTAAFTTHSSSGGGGDGSSRSSSDPAATSLAPPPTQRGWPQSELVELAEPATAPAPSTAAVVDETPSADACPCPALQGAEAAAAAGAVPPPSDFTDTGGTRGGYAARGVDAPFGHAVIIEEHVQAVAAVTTATAPAVAVVVGASPSSPPGGTGPAVSVELAEETALSLSGSCLVGVDGQPVGCGGTAAANGRARVVEEASAGDGFVETGPASGTAAGTVAAGSGSSGCYTACHRGRP